MAFPDSSSVLYKSQSANFHKLDLPRWSFVTGRLGKVGGYGDKLSLLPPSSQKLGTPQSFSTAV